MTTGTLVDIGLRVGRWAGFVAPVVGFLVFLIVPFKVAVTLYAATATLGMVLARVLDEVQQRRAIEAIARREVHGYTR